MQNATGKRPLHGLVKLNNISVQRFFKLKLKQWYWAGVNESLAVCKLLH